VNHSVRLDTIVLATGGAIDPKCKQTDSSFNLIKTCGVTLTPIHPALTAFKTEKVLKNVKGVRSAGRLSLSDGNKIVAQTYGEIQYTDYGLSGIPAMQLSSYYARIENKKNAFITADSLPDMDYSSLRNRFAALKNKRPDLSAGLFCSGLVPKRLGDAFLNDSGINPAESIDSIDNKAFAGLMECFKQKKYVISGVLGFENAQVTSGGIAENEITEELMLKKLPGVFVCGEIVDIDGDCGGYNLQWAWSSGATAGKNCIRRIL
jgi:predicted Rossmann fold flavoprotein